MLDFVFSTPTKVYFGKGRQKEVGKIVKEFGYKKVMIQYGRSSAVKSGLIGEVTTSFEKEGIDYVLMGGVEPNPKLNFVRTAIKKAREEKVDLILAVGGGSAIDSSKATAIGTLSSGDIWDIYMGKAKIENALPVGCILTISASGSEMSSSAVITNTDLKMKKGIVTELNRCKFAILNPELTYSLPKYQTACGIVDMISHALERYFSNVPDTPLTDNVTEGIIRAIIDAGEILINNPTDYNASATIMWGSSLAHNGITGVGRENYLAVHQLEHALSGVFDEVVHGAGLAVLYPAWARYVYKHNVYRFAKFARNVMRVSEDNDELAAIKGIDKLQEFFVKLGMPTKLSDFNINEASLDELANATTFNQTRVINGYVTLGFKEVREIFKSCL